MGKRIIKAKTMGFCPGVKRAIEQTRKAAASGEIFTLGMLVHNDAVVKELERLGIKAADSLDDISGTATITAHGAAPSVYQELRDRGLKLLDTTCPTVRKAQQKASRFGKEGYFVVVYGDPDHVEVKGILGWAGPNSIATLSASGAFKEKLPKRLAVLSQTTRVPVEFHAFISQLLAPMEKFEDVRIAVTLCPHVVRRAEEAASMASETDLVVVVGDPKSANSNRLVERCNQVGRAKLVWSVQSLETQSPEIKSARTIGITSGTSTPDWLIDEVASAIEGME